VFVVTTQPRQRRRAYFVGAVLAYLGAVGAGFFGLFAAFGIRGYAFFAYYALLPVCGVAAIAQAAVFYILLRGRAVSFWEATRLWFKTSAVGFALWWAGFYAWTFYASAQTEIVIAEGIGASAMLVVLVSGALLMFFFRPNKESP
jgi:hypothetical protein